MIKVAIVDDQDILREGLRMLIGAENDIKIVTTGNNGLEAYRICCQELIDVILMDIKMPIMNGVEATKKIKKDYPNIKIIILTTFKDDSFIFDALEYGASGYLLKDTPPEKISEAIREVYKGGAIIQPDIAIKLVERLKVLNKPTLEHKIDSRISLLTERETEIIKLVGEGFCNKEIAEKLFITEGTAKNHISNILTKLELRDRTQLAIFSLKNQFLWQ